MVDASRSYAIHHFVSWIASMISNLMIHDEKQVREISMNTLRSLT